MPGGSRVMDQLGTLKDIAKIHTGLAPEFSPHPGFFVISVLKVVVGRGSYPGRRDTKNLPIEASKKIDDGDGVKIVHDEFLVSVEVVEVLDLCL